MEAFGIRGWFKRKSRKALRRLRRHPRGERGPRHARDGGGDLDCAPCVTARLLMVLGPRRRARARGLRQQGRDPHDRRDRGHLHRRRRPQVPGPDLAQLNPRDIEDRNYLSGLPAGTLQPKADEAWFGVWLRVQNTTSEETFDDRRRVRDRRHAGEHVPADRFGSRTTRSPTAAGRSGPTIVPAELGPAGQGPIQGSLLLFKLTTDDARRTGRSSSRSPSPTDPEDVGIVDLDV